MKSMRPTRSLALFGIAAALAVQVPVSAAVVNFEDLGIAPGTQFSPSSPTPVVSGGMSFISGVGAAISDLHVGNGGTAGLAFWGVSNDTNHMLTHGHVIGTLVGGGLFSVSSVDLSGFQGVEAPVTVTGTYANATTVAIVLTLDGIIDGGGGAVDFQTFALPGGFSGLTKIEFTGGVGAASLLFAIDNINFTGGGQNTPDAGGTVLLLGLGLVLLAAGRRFQRS